MPTILGAFIPWLRLLQWIALGLAVVALGLAAVFPGEDASVIGMVFSFALAAPFIELAGWIVSKMRVQRSRSGAIAFLVVATAVAALSLGWHRWGFHGLGDVNIDGMFIVH